MQGLAASAAGHGGASPPCVWCGRSVPARRPPERSISVASDAAANGTPQTFTPWGTIKRGGISVTSLNFTGQRLDSGSGLLYYHARYYDPALARFVSADTIIPGQANKAGTPDPPSTSTATPTD